MLYELEAIAIINETFERLLAIGCKNPLAARVLQRNELFKVFLCWRLNFDSLDSLYSLDRLDCLYSFDRFDNFDRFALQFLKNHLKFFYLLLAKVIQA